MYIVLTILMFGLLIFFHELGHFTVARLFKVKINEFAIGMGPKIFSRKAKSDIVYSLRLLPIGGFVSMEGENGVEEENKNPEEVEPEATDGADISAVSGNSDVPEKEAEDTLSPNAYCKKPVWQRMLILFAGPFMNILIAIILMLGIVCTSQNLASTTIHSFNENSVSNAEGGLMVEDKVVKVGWVPVFSGNELVYEIVNQGSEPIDITVIRNGEKIVLKDVKFGVQTEDEVTFGTPDFMVYAEHKTILNCLKQSATRSMSAFKMVIDSLSGMLTGKYGMDAIQGPVGITGEIQDMENQGLMDITTFVYFASVISMNLGIFNLIPLPALDGGQLLFRFIELIRRKPLNQKIEGMLNFIMLILLMAFAGVVLLKDIIALFF